MKFTPRFNRHASALPNGRYRLVVTDSHTAGAKALPGEYETLAEAKQAQDDRWQEFNAAEKALKSDAVELDRR